MSFAQPQIPSPIRFGRYELVQRIGAGGMGEVWLARLPGLDGVGKICVVKKMLPSLSTERNFVRRFLDEAKVVVHLNHGNIAQVFEMGEVNGEYFIAMEYVEGKTVSRVIARMRERNERFPLPLALYVGQRACEALSYAHRKTDLQNRPLHVVHRDISPSNVIISYDGEVKLIDFGAAQSTLKEAQTAPRVVIGNLAYMSPEQARKQPVDGRADIYSISVMLWELIAWHPLPTGGDPSERWRRAAFPKFKPPSLLQPDVPPSLDAIVMRGLALDPLDRYPNAETLRDELQRALTQMASKTSQSTLGALMLALFRQEANQDRAAVAKILACFDAEPTERSRRVVEPAADPDDVTLTGEHAGSPGLSGARGPAAPPVHRLAPPVDPASSPSIRRAAPLQPEAGGAAAASFRLDQAPDLDRTRPGSPPSASIRPPPLSDAPTLRRLAGGHRTEELPTLTYAPSPPPRPSRSSSQTRTVDFRQTPRSARAALFQALLFVGAFVVGALVAILLSRLVSFSSQPPSTAPSASTAPAERR